MSYVPDSIIEPLQDGLHQLGAIRQIEDGWRVVTHCMYPSNGLVEVTVRGGNNLIVASDEGGALGEALSAGITAGKSDRALKHLIADQGLIIKEGVIYTPQLPIDAVAVSVLHVANASQNVARWLLGHTKVNMRRNFKGLLADALLKNFDKRVKQEIIHGQSTKGHRFPNVVALGSGRRLIVDPVENDPSSINARIIANLDVKQLQDPTLEQRIVYDDDETWSAANLNLLQVGATVVPFSRMQPVLKRIAANG